MKKEKKATKMWLMRMLFALKEKVTKIWLMRMIFALIAFGFTLISAWNGYHFYKILFGWSTAIIISVTFEVARFACLFRYRDTDSKMSIPTIIFYVITASVCAFASINSFTTEIIMLNRVNEKEFQKIAYSIKQSYLKETAPKLITFDRDIRVIENNIAKYPKSGYWKKRLSQVQKNRDKFLQDREKFLSHKPEDMEQWIRVESVRLGVKTSETTKQNEKMIAVKQALKELWSLEEMTAQKIIGIIVTIVVELSIILLAMLAMKGKEPEPNKLFQRKLNKKKLLAHAKAIFGEKLVYKFLASCGNSYRETGKLPPMSRLSKDIRPVRLYFEDIGAHNLHELLE